MMEKMLIIVLAIFCFQLLLSIWLIVLSKRKKAQSGFFLDQLSVIIPFRDEEKRIEQLIHSLNDLEMNTELATEFIFVDDHSSDQTAEIIRQKMLLPYRLITAHETGKKAAIHEGVKAAGYNYVLTLDADVELHRLFFQQLATLPEADMWVLPVKMKGTNLIAKLGSVDFRWIQLLTRALINSGHPFFANGANLLFSKSLYLKTAPLRTDHKEVSGDDLFLLAAFKKEGARINTTADSHLSVTTAAPSSFKALLQQRKRWAFKMNKLITKEVVFFAAFLFIVECGMFLSLMGLFYSAYFLIPISIKLGVEGCLYRAEKRTFKWTDLLVLLLHQIWFPFYLLAIMFWPLPPENKWAKKEVIH